MESFILFITVGTAAIAMFAGVRHLASVRRGRRAFISTGLKAVDLFVPLPRGGDVLITGPKGAGIVVLGLEIVRRLLKHPAEKFHVVYFLDEGLSDLSVRTQEMDELLSDLTSRLLVAGVTEAHLEQIMKSSQGRQIVVFAASENHRFLQTFVDAVSHVREDSTNSQWLTTVTLTETSVTAEFDARIECSRLIAKQGIYPAIDVSASYSTVYERADAPRRQKAIARTVATSVAQLTPLMYDGAAQDPAWISTLDAQKLTALQALNFLSQVFMTAEVYTGKKGRFIATADAVRDFETIMSGEKNGVAPRLFSYVDCLPQS